ncbi:hypothetical protein CVIRNUC_009632 [Coccomyxa viridis]|uniref:Uncharacterized protein n=1 Tax=Coccomyxa viridis TaxID=1274662 RepID=A0AAV1IGG5_9CHLO|nr:hypothetical protein CVIRNUC_009632 [Coccomyxa viridis]
MKLQTPPEYVLRGLRMALGVAACLAIGFMGINYQFIDQGKWGEHMCDLVGNAARSGAITCVIVASPVIGRVVVVGSDRTIGTVAGGVTGWLCFMAAYQMTRSHYLWQYAVLCLMVTVFAWASVIVGWWAARLETTPKLFTLTFVLVAFSAKDMTNAFEVMVSRISGIVGGTLISLLLAVTVYPSSATQELLQDLKVALRGLTELNKSAVREAAHALGHATQPGEDREHREEEDTGVDKPLLGRNEAAGHSKACEAGLVGILAALSRATEALPLSQREAYIGTFLGRMWFLPGVKWFRMRHLPYEETEEVIMEIRFTAWLLWRIHLAFRQMGVGGGMGAQFALAFLKSLPFGLVLELAEASQESFTWLAEHFPDVDRENPGLERLKRAVKALLENMDRQHAHILKQLRSGQGDKKNKSKQPAQTAMIQHLAEGTFDIEQGLKPQSDKGEDGGAGQKSAFPKIKEDLWNTAQEQVSMDMPESHEKAERGQMAEDGLAGASPEDQTAFPSNVEDQVAEVRWYSMGVLMEELEEAVEGLQCHLHEYSRHLPDAAIKLYAKDHPAPEKDMLSP